MLNTSLFELQLTDAIPLGSICYFVINVVIAADQAAGQARQFFYVFTNVVTCNFLHYRTLVCKSLVTVKIKEKKVKIVI